MNENVLPEVIAYCGLDCSGCPIYLATREPDHETQRAKRIEIASLLRSRYGMELTADEIGDCDGCRTTAGIMFSGCAKCGIRKCAISKSIDRCSSCPDYACDMLRGFIEKESGRE